MNVEKVLSAHVSDAVVEELAQDRKLEWDHDDSTQFNLRVRIDGSALPSTSLVHWDRPLLKSTSRETVFHCIARGKVGGTTRRAHGSSTQSSSLYWMLVCASLLMVRQNR